MAYKAYYKFNETSGNNVYDSLGSLNGTMTGTIGIGMGRTRQVSTDGAQALYPTTNASLVKDTNDFTFSTRIKFNNLGLTQNDIFFLQGVSGQAIYIGYNRDSANTTLFWYVDGNRADQTHTMVNGKRYQITATRSSGGVYNIWQDGKLLGGGTGVNGRSYGNGGTSNGFSIGSFRYDAAFGTDAWYDEAIIDNTAWSNARIVNHVAFNKGFF